MAYTQLLATLLTRLTGLIVDAMAVHQSITTAFVQKCYSWHMGVLNKHAIKHQTNAKQTASHNQTHT
jgi:hypothetical protein